MLRSVFFFITLFFFLGAQTGIAKPLDLDLSLPAATPSMPVQYSHRQNNEPLTDLTQTTINLGVMSLGLMFVIAAAPEDVTKWNRDELTPSKWPGNWLENNKKGPVWDNDVHATNYLGHSYAGAIYYTAARSHNLTPQQSFTYTFMLSTFMWEMGMEAVAEPPSIQDILVTPIIGSIVGEAFYTWEQRIMDNNRSLLGSTALGNSAVFLLNPAGQLSRMINKGLGNKDLIKDSEVAWTFQRSEANNSSNIIAGLDIRLLF